MSIKQNIELQEKELEIDSLTLEEINIKRDIEKHERELLRERQQQEDLYEDEVIKDEGEDIEADTSDMFPEAKLNTQEDLFSLEEQKTGGESPAYESAEGIFSKDELEGPEEANIPEIKYEQEIDNENGMEMDFQPGTFTTRKMEIPDASHPPYEEIAKEEEFSYDNETAVDLDLEGSDEEIPEPPVTREFEVPGLESSPALPEMELPDMMAETELIKPPGVRGIPGTSAQELAATPAEEAIPILEEPEEPGELKKPATVEIPKIPQVPKVPPVPKVPQAQKAQKAPQVPKRAEARETPPVTQAPLRPEKKSETVIPPDVILDKIGDKLSHAIKEMLWEIVPPLAEKIIKEEIENLKLETEKSLE